MHYLWDRKCQSWRPGTLLADRRIYTFWILILFRRTLFWMPFLLFFHLKDIRKWENEWFWSISRCHGEIRDVHEFHVVAGQSLTRRIREGQAGTTDVGCWKPHGSNTRIIYTPPTNLPWLSYITQNNAWYVYATVVWNETNPIPQYFSRMTQTK